MTPALRQFLSDWLAWAEAGAPEHPVFTRFWGLCFCAHKYGGVPLGIEIEIMSGPKRFPFGGPKDFQRRMDEGTQHLNPARLAWVRQQLGVEEGKDLHESLMQAHRDSVTVKGPIRAKEGGE